jgi:acyl-CoA thioesterase I
MSGAAAFISGFTIYSEDQTMFRSYGVFHAAYKHLLVVAALLAAFPAQAADKLILAFGDSLTAGYGLSATESYPAQLQAQLRQQGISVRVHNAGVSGDTTSGGRARLGWVIASLKTTPDLVILCLGANDSLRGVDPKLTRANLDAMMAELQKRKIRVLLAGMLAPPNMGREYATSYNRIFPDLAKQYSAFYYPFLLDGVAANGKLLLEDGMHPSKQGAAIIAAKIAPIVRRALEKK